MARRRWMVGTTLAACALVMAWWQLTRLTVVQGDDFTSAAIGGARGGRFTVSAWLHQALHDWWSATGRQSGSVFRIVQRCGTDITTLAMAVVQVSLAFVLVGWGHPSRLPTPARVGLTLVALGVVPIAGLTAPAVNGDAIFWMLASFDYVFSPTIALLAALLLLRQLEDGRSVPRTWWPVLALAPIFHETSSAALVAVLLGITCLHGARGHARTPIALVALGCLVQLTSPGLWRRRENFETALAEHGLALRLHQLVFSSSTLVQVGHWQLVVISVLMLSLGRRRLGSLVLPLLAGAAVLLAWHLNDGLRRPLAAGYRRQLSPDARQLGLSVAALLGVALLALLAQAWRERTIMGPRPLLAVLGMGGSFGPVLLTGVTTTRAYLPCLVWTGAVVCALCSVMADRTRHSSHRGAAVMVLVLGLVALGLGCRWGWQSHRALRQNREVHQLIVAQLDEARAGRRTVVTFPAAWPNPRYQYARGFLLSRYGPVISAYYELPEGVGLVQGR